MTYYGARIYNYSNLKEEDKKMVKAMYYVLKMVEDITDEHEERVGESLLDRLQDEIAITTINDVANRIRINLVEWIVGCIDSYDEDIEPIDTTNHFHGLDGE